MSKEGNFVCLRCMHEYTGPYNPKVVEEKTCPKCHSNSVRRLKKKKKKAVAEA
jgi:ssDNA-binding Zn-finger/Zn-ribbon topoisomerase 1